MDRQADDKSSWMLRVQLCLEESWHPPAFAKHNDPAEHGGLAKHARGKARASGGG